MGGLHRGIQRSCWLWALSNVVVRRGLVLGNASMSSPRDDEVEAAVFVRWVNHCLQDPELSIEDLETGFKDGIVLTRLVETLSGLKLGKINSNPKLGVQRMDNISKCFEALATKFSIVAPVGLSVQGGSLAHAGFAALLRWRGGYVRYPRLTGGQIWHTASQTQHFSETCCGTWLCGFRLAQRSNTRARPPGHRTRRRPLPG